MKKKIIAVAMIIVCARFSLFAEGTKISIAGVWHADTVKVGGGFEIGFPIVEKAMEVLSMLFRLESVVSLISFNLVVV